MTRKKILCLLSDIGGAHVSIARVFEENLKKDFDFPIVDLYRETSAFCYGSLKLYARVLRDFPRFYNFFYDFNDKRILWNAIYRCFIKRLMMDRTKDLILTERPDAVVSLFALTSRIAADARAELGLEGKLPLIVFVVDPFTIHLSWVEPRTDLYLVPSLDGRRFLASRGVKQETMRIIRYPVKSVFGEKYDRVELRKKHGIDASARTVLIMGGGDGVIPADEISRVLLREDGDVQVVAVAGRNRVLFHDLEASAAKWNGRMKVHGYTDIIHELMTLADIVITKPGPSTIMEAIESELPVVLTGFVPRQEEGNIDYVVSHELGVYIRLKEISRVCAYLHDENWIGRVRRNMNIMKRSFPDATGVDEIRRIVGRADDPRVH